MRRILVVEDDPINLELLTAILESEGCRVLAAERARQAIALARSERPNLILLDVQLPEMSGYEAARRLRADPATATIPIIAVTAHAMQGEEARARAAGCDGYLPKPVNRRALREMLRRWLSDGSGSGAG